MEVVGKVREVKKWCHHAVIRGPGQWRGEDPKGPCSPDGLTGLRVPIPTLPRQILEIPDGHRAPAPPQSGSCDHHLLLLEPGNLASSPSMPLASPQPSGQTSREEHRGAAEELASVPNDKGKLGRPRLHGPCRVWGHLCTLSQLVSFWPALLLTNRLEYLHSVCYIDP